MEIVARELCEGSRRSFSRQSERLGAEAEQRGPTGVMVNLLKG